MLDFGQFSGYTIVVPGNPNPSVPLDELDPEARAHELIREKLTAAGWVIQHYRNMNISASRGVAVREFSLKPGHGEADYLLYVDGKAAGVVEAKPVGHTLSGVEPQSQRYAEGLPDGLPAHFRPLPFLYLSTGIETRLTNLLEEDARSRDVFSFLRPETIADLCRDGANQLRNNVRHMPALDERGLWKAQIKAIRRLDESLAHGRPRALIQMATGSGKTFMAANAAYRLIKHGNARRVLFLVDRGNLGKQTDTEFKNMVPPDDPRLLGSIYNIHRLAKNYINPSDRMVITTIQRVYSMLKGEEEFDEDREDDSSFAVAAGLFKEPMPVEYNSKLPPETFDVIVVDECHRSIYGLWRQVLEYFDAFIIGLTATPTKQTVGFFNQNLVMTYGHKQAVADGVNVPSDTYRIKTKITEKGSTVEAGLYVDKRDRLTRKKRAEVLDNDLTYTGNQLDRDVVAPDQIRTIIKAFRDRILPEAYPERDNVPKTLIFAKDDSHAEDIVGIVREEFGKGDDFCQKITYRTGFIRVPLPGHEAETNPPHTWQKVSAMDGEDILRIFRTSFNPRVAVTVDMIATGTDVKAIEVLLFLRNVVSAGFFEQMKGRGVRVMDPDKLKEVTPDATIKDRFIIVDAVGVCERDKTETTPLERKPNVSLKRLLVFVAAGGTGEDEFESLAGRLARLDRKLVPELREELSKLADGKSLKVLAGALVRATDPDEQEAAARAKAGLETDQQPTEQQVAEATRHLEQEAARPFHNPRLRQRILELQQESEQVIDTFSGDELLSSQLSKDTSERAREVVQDFREWIEQNKDEIEALQVLYSGRYANRLKLKDVKALAQLLKRPPLTTNLSEVWHAFEVVEGRKPAGSRLKQAADLIRLVRHAVAPAEPLAAFSESVVGRYQNWLATQAKAGVAFSEQQRQWLDKIAEHIGNSVTFEQEDFDYGWFAQHGHLGKAHQLFGERLPGLVASLNETLAA